MAALNIQRGRDHGLPGYNLYRAICNLTRADDFNGLRREIAPPVIERLRRTYAHVDDVDLFTGWYSTFFGLFLQSFRNNKYMYNKLTCVLCKRQPFFQKKNVGTENKNDAFLVKHQNLEKKIFSVGVGIAKILAHHHLKK